MTASPAAGVTDAPALYLDLLKNCLTRYIFGEGYRELDVPRRGVWRFVAPPADRLLEWLDVRVVRPVHFDPALRAEGKDRPLDAETMIGLRRLENLQHCVVDALANGVPGDLIETGAWRGGATIFMRGILKAYGVTDRTVWVADSFQGLPKPSGDYEADRGDRHWVSSTLVVPLDEVKANFARYGLLDDQVRFLVGWFSETLPAAPVDKLAVMRLDGDMYESTSVALESLYPKLSPGGYVIIDDWGAVRGCRLAVEDFRARHDVRDAIQEIDWAGVYWQKSRA